MTSETVARAATDSQTSEVRLVMMTLMVEGVEEPGRFVMNDEDVHHQGGLYRASGFQYKPPPQGSESRTLAQLRIDNVDRVMSQTIKDLAVAPRVHIFSVLASDPDTIIEDAPTFTLFNIVWNLYDMQASLGLPDDSDEPSVSYQYTPSTAPALFAS